MLVDVQCADSYFSELTCCFSVSLIQIIYYLFLLMYRATIFLALWTTIFLFLRIINQCYKTTILLPIRLPYSSSLHLFHLHCKSLPVHLNLIKFGLKFNKKNKINLLLERYRTVPLFSLLEMFVKSAKETPNLTTNFDENYIARPQDITLILIEGATHETQCRETSTACESPRTRT